MGHTYERNFTSNRWLFLFLSSDFRGNNSACAVCTKCAESRRNGREEAKKWVKRTTSVFCLFLPLCFSSHFFSESKTRGEKKNTRGANFLSNGFFCCRHTRFPNWGAKMCTSPPKKGVILKMAGGHRANIYSRREKQQCTRIGGLFPPKEAKRGGENRMHLFSSSFAVSPPFFLPAAVADRSSNDRRLTSSSSSSCCCLGLGNKLFEPVKEGGGVSHPIPKSWWEMNHPLFIEMANPSSLGSPYNIVSGCDPPFPFCQNNFRGCISSPPSVLE